MNEHGFIMFKRAPETDELLRDPLAFAVLAQIAMRARWRTVFSSHGLEIGEALIGDHKSLGMTRAEYRTRVDRLKKWQLITTRTTNRGTIAKLISSLVFDINQTPNDQPGNHQEHRQKTNREPSVNHQKTNREPLTKKDNKERKRERENGRPRMFISEAKARIVAIDEEIGSIKSSYKNFVLDDGVVAPCSKLKPEAMARIAELTQSKHEAERILKGV